MPYESYMLRDVSAVLLATLVSALFLVIPGYTLGFLFDVLSFRRRALVPRVAIGIILSTAIMPGLTYLVGRLTSFEFIWALYGITWVVFLFLLVRRLTRPVGLASFMRSNGLLGMAVAVVVFWLIVGLWYNVAFQRGDRMFLSLYHDTQSLYVATVYSVSKGVIPPYNYMFYPGSFIALKYHYFWFLTNSLVDLLGGAAIEPYAAFFAGTAWSGIAMTALTAVFVASYFESRRSAVFVALGLLLVGGLDILAIVVVAVVSHQPNVPPEMWNYGAQVFTWLDSITIQPHHRASLVAYMTGYLLWMSARKTNGLRERTAAFALAPIAFMSSIGLSTHMGMVGMIALAVWTLIALGRRQYREFRDVAVMGAITAILTVPYLLDLLGGGTAAGPMFGLTVRLFRPAALLLDRAGVGESWTRYAVYLLVLPLNYFIEFGYLAVAPIIHWVQRRKSSVRASQDDLFLLTLLFTGLVLISFVQSPTDEGPNYNALGLNGSGFAQFIFLVYSVDTTRALLARFGGYVKTIWAPTWLGLTRASATTLLALLIAGFATSAYGTLMSRAYAMLLDRWNPSMHYAERAYAYRQAYEWIDESLPEEIVVQHNVLLGSCAYHGLYGNRLAAALQRQNMRIMGADAAGCAIIERGVRAIYDGGINADSVDALCTRLSIDVLVVRAEDHELWNNSDAWIHHREPIYENKYAKVFACGAFGMRVQKRK